MITLDRASASVAAGEAGGFTTSAKLKLDELFVTWLSYSDTCQYISNVISSFKTSPTSPSSPLESPVSDPSTFSASSPRKYSPRKYNRSYAARSVSSPVSSPVSTSPLSPISPRAAETRGSEQHHDFSLEAPSSPALKHKEYKVQQQLHQLQQQQQQLQQQKSQQDSYAAIPRFYYPSNNNNDNNTTLYPPLTKDDVALPKISASFSASRLLPLQEVLAVLSAALPGLPLVVIRYMLEKEGEPKFDEERLLKLYRLCVDLVDITGRDAAAVIFEVLRQPNANILQAADFRAFLRLILESHPGLAFLANTPEFQERYLETILVRIFYNTPRGITGKMDLAQLRKSGLVAALLFIDNETDINKSMDFFSYEHFYVIYCKFWEVDTDHDLIISADDLMRYSGGPPTRRVADRIASIPIFPRDPDLARVLTSKLRRQRGNKKTGLMTYQDFVWYILSEEDRDSSTALEYWFRMLDIDEDGYWSSYELEYFYLDMMPYLRDLGMDPPPFEDLLCQWLDMLFPDHAGRTTAWDCPRVNITVSDLRKCKLAKTIIHSLVSPTKFLLQETKDPFAEPRDGVSDWGRFALVEYELAVADQSEQMQGDD